MITVLTCSFILLVILAIASLRSVVKTDSQSNETAQQSDDTDDLVIPTITTPESPYKCFRIAGIRNYCNFSDVGPISGELRKEPDNRYDRNAVMVIEANKEKILGYIPKEQKSEYKKISQGLDRRPFVGFIDTFLDEDGRQGIFGIIRTYAGAEDDVMKDAQNDWDFLHAAYRIKSHEKRMEVLEQFKY